MTTKLEHCRLCKNTHLVPILDLGVQALTGTFPKPGEPVPEEPLVLVKCHGTSSCGLVQLGHTGDLAAMYGDSYGYRSGLNASMVNHLTRKVASLVERRPLAEGDVVLDIGSNDGTTLSKYPSSVVRIGIDPTAATFLRYYPADVRVAAQFFSPSAFTALSDGKKASIVTSIAMFYDLPDPLAFAEGIASILAHDGIWHLEQSYLPTMLQANAYDTVCHEHLEYYGLRQIQWIMDRAGLEIVDVQKNDINGGSFAVTVQKWRGARPAMAQAIVDLLDNEDAMGLYALRPYDAFRTSVESHREHFRARLEELKNEGKRVFGLGASTKGNVLLQYAGITPDLLPAIAEVNPVKFGRVTPGTNIPIISEDEARAMRPDVFVVLPWHFRDAFIAREKDFLVKGGTLLFPLPCLDEVTAASSGDSQWK